jgi:OOP family OmpA-OmpF porin
MKKLILSGLFMILTLSFASAQNPKDFEGCKDHPLLTRMSNYYISECSIKYDQVYFANTAGEEVIIEGNVSYFWYIFDTESGANEPSPFQILKNYANAIKAIGGKKVYEDATMGFYEIKKDGKQIKVKVLTLNSSDIQLSVCEMEEMTQEITANDMLDALNKNGSIALNILFETGKSTIEKESLKIVDQIYDLLSNNNDLKVSIEGHTDNVGAAASNKTLSQARAKSVTDALIAKGIDKSRLSFLGWGQEKPVADNSTDEGRAKNRRVEIVKK